jgi:translation initiation factor 1A
MPNTTGGKKYKSGKGGGPMRAEFHDINEEDGQSVGRVIRALGDRNMLLYCNDGKERIAHIRGGLRKKTAKIEVGDLVLWSIREPDALGKLGRGDILAKYEREVHNQLKKHPGINAALFTQMEVMDARQRAQGVTKETEDGYVFDDSEDEAEDDEDDSEDSEAAEKARVAKKAEAEKKRVAERKLKQGATAEDGDNSDVDIDAI